MIRSLLFVPAKDKMLKKIPALKADAFIIDLEDSIKPEEKEIALKVLCDFLGTNNLNNIFVRLNKDNYYQEGVILQNYNIGFMLPKFESPNDYHLLTEVWNSHKVIALIETPIGIINIHDISTCSWISAIAFGAEDFTASMNMQNLNELLQPFKTQLLLHAKANSKQIYDTPSFNISETNLFEKDVENSVSLGFDGKMLISPKHIDFINLSFKKYDFDYLKFIIEEYEKAGSAVVIIDGKVYEKMHINRFRKILKENNKA